MPMRLLCLHGMGTNVKVRSASSHALFDAEKLTDIIIAQILQAQLGKRISHNSLNRD